MKYFENNEYFIVSKGSDPLYDYCDDEKYIEYVYNQEAKEVFLKDLKKSCRIPLKSIKDPSKISIERFWEVA